MSVQTDKLREESKDLLSRIKLHFEYQEDDVVHKLLKSRIAAKRRAKSANR